MDRCRRIRRRQRGSLPVGSRVGAPPVSAFAAPRSLLLLSLSALLVVAACSYQCRGFAPAAAPLHAHHHRRTRTTPRKNIAFQLNESSLLDDDRDKEAPRPDLVGRRRALATMASATSALLLPALAQADTATTTTPASNDPLEGLLLGDGRWQPLGRSSTTTASISAKPRIAPSFLTYAARILIRYDPSVADWWQSLEFQYSLLSQQDRLTKLGRAFGSLAKSLELAFEPLFITESTTTSAAAAAAAYTTLWDLFTDRYGREPDAARQIAILFALLPASDQPVQRLAKALVVQRQRQTNSMSSSSSSSSSETDESSATTADAWTRDLTTLLPPIYQCVSVRDGDTVSFAVSPEIQLFEIGIDEEFGQTAVATTFGPLSETVLTRELPVYSALTYCLFGISGATGCALTHSVVIPLDVVKTRAQTDPNMPKSVWKGARQIVQTDGWQGLVLGAQATLAGYLWYGVSVYPSYTFFKRWLGHSVLSPAVAAVHINDVALLAGALAAVVASMGLTPLEAARIRVVAEPETYRSLGLLGTLQVIATEDAELGWKGLYSGLPSLLTRQVIFGSIKFLAFERASDLILGTWPVLGDETWTSLAVSLVAGGLSGVLSSVVSQPADSVLTYVAQDKGSNVGVLESVRTMVETDGAGALFRGLGSRCVWAGSIIAGQFLLYDVFRTYFGVSADDLSQVYHVVLETRSV